MIHPWQVLAQHPTQTQPLGCYVSHNEAQGAAATYRKIFGGQIAIRVVKAEQP